MKIKIDNLIFFLLHLIFLSSSMDIFLNVSLFGFTIRFVFIPIFLILILWALYLFFSRKNTINLLSYKPLTIWLLLLILFIPNTTIIARNIAYIIWLIFYILFLPALSSFITSIFQLHKLLRIYISSFFWISCFGIFQFVLGSLGIDILIQQHWLNGLPRANGFSYEPSYLATYLLIGWVLCFYLLISRSRFTKTFNCNRNIFVISLAIILSGSRLGIFFILIITLIYVAYNVILNIKYLKTSKLVFKYLCILSFLVFSGILYFVANRNQAVVYVNGLGLYGTVDHSYKVRSNDQGDTFKAFLNSPIIGYSLGGIPSQIAKIRGYNIDSQKDAKNFEGINIFAEILAASGIIGFLFFIYYLFTLFKSNLKLIKILKTHDYENAKILLAILISLLCEFLILIFNQNILRAYLWVHIAILNTAYYLFHKYATDYYQSLQLKSPVNINENTHHRF